MTLLESNRIKKEIYDNIVLIRALEIRTKLLKKKWSIERERIKLDLNPSLIDIMFEEELPF
jgi:hypothetical protein